MRVALVLLSSLAVSCTPRAEHPVASHRFRVPVEGAPVLGPRDAVVTLVVFSDLECPYCGRAAPELRQMVEEGEGQVRLVFRHRPLPFHQRAEPAAMAAIEVFEQLGDEGFWRFHDRVFERGGLSDDQLVAHAAAVGADEAKVRLALRERRHAEVLAGDLAEAQRLGVDGTPTLFVNGRVLLGLRKAVIQTWIAEERDAAAEAIADGTPRAEYYAYIQRNTAERRGETPSPSAEPEAEPEESAIAEHAQAASAPRSSPGPLPEDFEMQSGAPPVPSDAPGRGPTDAAVIVQVFSDFECPYCARAKALADRIHGTYPEQVRVVFRHMPLARHRHAMDAARASMAVYEHGGDDAFWQYHDRLFAHQDALSPPELVAHAETLELDAGRVQEAIESGSFQDRVDADRAAGAAHGVRSTPTFFIGDQMISGARPFIELEELIDQLLEGS